MTKKSNSKKETSNSKVLINVVLDRSGSMGAIKEATIAGFNSYLQEQSQIKGARFSLMQFDSEGIDQLYKDVAASKVRPLDSKTFQPRGGTPLYDAVGHSINEVKATDTKGRKVVFVIITDGQENSSREFTRQQIFDEVAELRSAGWEFVFLGANVDAYATSSGLGFDVASTYQYGADSDSVSKAFASVSQGTTSYRLGASQNMVLDKSHEAPIPKA